MAFVDNNDTAQLDSFRVKVKQAVLRSAINIQAEIAGTTNHTNRANLATKVLGTQEQDQLVTRFAFAAASDGATTNASTDAQIETRVSSIWNAIAGTL